MTVDSGAVLLFGVPTFALFAIVAGLLFKKSGLFWTGDGVLMGLGLISLGTIGVPFLLAGVWLVWLGFRRFGSGAEDSQAWISLVSLGITPAFVIAYGYYTADRQTTSYSDDYLALALPFLAISLLGVLLGVVEALRKGRVR
jgi:hypothetical protein